MASPILDLDRPPAATAAGVGGDVTVTRPDDSVAAPVAGLDFAGQTRDLAVGAGTGGRRNSDEESWWERWRLTGAAALCWVLLLAAVAVDHLTPAPHGFVVALYGLAYLAGGAFATIKALRDLFVHRTVNVDLLMVTAAIRAAIVDAWAEGAILLGLFASSSALEHHALGRTRRAVRALMELSPEVATVLRPDGELVVPVEELRLGEVVLVRPGERVAVDGVVLAGETAIDQSTITGESIPVGKQPGDPVFAGTINGFGAVRVRVERLHRESTLAKIVAFVAAAQEQKSRTQRFADAFEGRYAVGVIAAAALLAVIPPVAFGQEWGASFYRAMTLLVVASPCALVISTPASTLSALANAARNGILFKGGGYLEEAGAVRIVAFDKTGTLTYGRPALTDVVALGRGWDEDEVLRRAASAERLSEHHLAVAIVRAAGERGLPLGEAVAFRAVPGKGILAQVGGDEVVIGNDALFAELGAPVSPAARAIADRLRGEGKTAMLVGDRGGVRGVIAVADTLRPAARGVVAELKGLGIARTVMLTGDNERVARGDRGRIGDRRSPGRPAAGGEAGRRRGAVAAGDGGDGRRRGERRAGAGEGDAGGGDGRGGDGRGAGDGGRGPDGRRPEQAALRDRPQPPRPPHDPAEPGVFAGGDRRFGDGGADGRDPAAAGRGRPRGIDGDRGAERVAAAADGGAYGDGPGGNIVGKLVVVARIDGGDRRPSRAGRVTSDE